MDCFARGPADPQRFADGGADTGVYGLDSCGFFYIFIRCCEFCCQYASTIFCLDRLVPEIDWCPRVESPGVRIVGLASESQVFSLPELESRVLIYLTLESESREKKQGLRITGERPKPPPPHLC